MEITTVNQLIAACSGLAGALIGAGISGFVNYRLEHSKRDFEAKTFLAGFVGEVKALRDVIIFRGYINTMEKALQMPEIQQGGRIEYKINLPEVFAPFYASNMSKVGLLAAQKASKLIQFHQLLLAIAQDFKPGSEVNEIGFSKEAMEETLQGMNAAMQLADEIVNWKVV